MLERDKSLVFDFNLKRFHSSNVSEPVSGRATNNAGEIQGATRAINDAGSMGTTRLRVNTDSEFLMKSVNGYMPTWKQNDWHKADGNPVVNHNDFRNLDRAMRNNSQMDVTFRHVPAHSGNPGNEGADRLAKQGAQRYGDGYYWNGDVR